MKNTKPLSDKRQVRGQPDACQNHYIAFYFLSVFVAKSLLIVWGTLPKSWRRTVSPFWDGGPSVPPPLHRPMAAISVFPVRVKSTYSKLFDQKMSNRQVCLAQFFAGGIKYFCRPLITCLRSAPVLVTCAPVRCSALTWGILK